MKKNFPVIIAAIWLATVCAGSTVLWVYDFTPGGTVGVPSRWPAQSTVPHPAGRPTLVMFAHPQCPCTRASMEELAVLLARNPKPMNASVVFLRPRGAGSDWLHSDLWQSAAAIPGVSVRADEEGREAAFFQANTSGQVVLYAADGKLLFSGGITSARGHSGDNAGRTALTKLLLYQVPDTSETPVFGCSLFSPPSSKGTCPSCRD